MKARHGSDVERKIQKAAQPGGLFDLRRSAGATPAPHDYFFPTGTFRLMVDLVRESKPLSVLVSLFWPSFSA
jgi:hypothetical protein